VVMGSKGPHSRPFALEPRRRCNYNRYRSKEPRRGHFRSSWPCRGAVGRT
jgi:hypothetical protein